MKEYTELMEAKLSKALSEVAQLTKEEIILFKMAFWSGVNAQHEVEKIMDKVFHAKD